MQGSKHQTAANRQKDARAVLKMLVAEALKEPPEGQPRTAAQIRAAEVFLRKTMPDLKATEITGEVTMKQFFIEHIQQADPETQQSEIWHSLRRFNVLLAHRRMGKTVLAVAWLIKQAQFCDKHRPQVHYYAPSYSQAKRVAWAYVKDFLSGTGTIFNESELKATMPNGAILQLGSAENPDASRGIYSDAVVLDEPADMPTRMWTEVLRPALSDRKGKAVFIGTPKGRHGLFYDSYQNAVEDPLWWRGCYRASDTGIIDEEELQDAQRTMSRAEYLQEYECDWSAAIQGAYWGERMNEIEEAGHITRVTHDPAKQVFTGWDLGLSDSTAIWFWQNDGDQMYFIDHEEYTNMGLPEIVAALQQKGYKYGRAVVPHDIRQRSLSTGLKRSDTLRQLGLDVVVAPKASNTGDVIDHIDVTRNVLKRCWFDSVNCRDGIECLRQYRAVWDDKHDVARQIPLHDWASHSADAMRYIATTPKHKIESTWEGGELEYASTGRY